MPLNIFAKVAPLLRETKFNNDSASIIDFLGKYHLGDWIYPSALHRELKLDIKSVYELLELCAEEGIIEQYLQIYCPECQRFIGSYYKTLLEIPETVNCLHCDTEITNPLQHAVIIYRVNNNEQR